MNMLFSLLRRNRRLPVLAAAGLLLLSAARTPVSAQSRRPKIGLVLSGGGAKGVAHIGALKVLEEAHIPIDYICGTSMGAIVGGLYAIGYNAEELDSIVRAQDWMFLFTDRLDRTHRSLQSKRQNDIYLLSVPFNHNQKIKLAQPAGIMKGQSILNKFSDLTLGYHDMQTFDSLPIPFSCIAADLISGQEVVMRQGSLPLAMRTSMSVPGFFEPIRKDSMVMIDGGVLNNFPVDVVKKMGADYVIGIDLSCDGLEEPKYHSLLDVANRIAFLSGEEKYARNKQEADLYINPELKGFESVDFKPAAIDTMIAMGERAARKSWGEITALKRKLRLDDSYRHPQRKFTPSTDSLHIDSMHIVGLASYNEDWLRKKVGFRNSATLLYSDIENIVWTLQGMGLFKKVSYKVTREDDHTSALFLFVEEKERGSINIGMHLDTEDVASALIQGKIGFGDKNQHTIGATAKINQNPWFTFKYSRSNKKMRSFSLGYTLAYKDFRLMQAGERLNNISFLTNQFKASYRDYSFKNFRYEGGIGYEVYSDASQLYTPQYKVYNCSNEDYAQAYFAIEYDTSDDRETPTQGTSLASYFQVVGNDLLKRDKHGFGTVAFNVRSAIPLSSRFTFLPELHGRFLIGSHIPGYFANYIGGEYNQRYLQGQHAFYGVHFAEIMDNTMAGGSCTIRYRLMKNHYVSCIGNFLFNSHHIKDIFQKDKYVGGAIKYTYNSMLGPISATLDCSNRSQKIGFFAGIGYFF